MSEVDQEVNDTAANIALGVEGLIGDLKARIETGDLTPENVQRLTMRPDLVEALREKIEASLLRAHVKGQQQGRRAIEAAKKRT